MVDKAVTVATTDLSCQSDYFSLMSVLGGQGLPSTCKVVLSLSYTFGFDDAPMVSALATCTELINSCGSSTLCIGLNDAVRL